MNVLTGNRSARIELEIDLESGSTCLRSGFSKDEAFSGQVVVNGVAGTRKK